MRFSIDFPELSRSKRRAGSKFFSGATRAPRKHTSCCGNGRHRCTGVNVYATGSNAPQHLWAMHGDLIPPTRCARLLAPFAHCRWGSLIAFAECHACLLSNVERDAAGGMSRSDLSGGEVGCFQFDPHRPAETCSAVKVGRVSRCATAGHWSPMLSTEQLPSMSKASVQPYPSVEEAVRPLLALCLSC
jgi:hypothetical protein